MDLVEAIGVELRLGEICRRRDAVIKALRHGRPTGVAMEGHRNDVVVALEGRQDRLPHVCAGRESMQQQERLALPCPVPDGREGS
jgi:hypothetical protein